MYRSILACLLTILILSCEEEKHTTINLYEHIPSSTSYFLQTPSLKDYLSAIDSIPLFQQNDLPGKAIENELMALSQLTHSQTTLLCLLPENETTTFLLITEEKLPGKITDSITKYLVNPLEDDLLPVKEYSGGNFHFYAIVKEGIFFASNSLQQLENLKKTEENYYQNNENLKRVLAATDQKKHTFFINNDQPGKNLFKGLNFPFSTPAAWTSMELDLSPEKVSFNGIATTAGSTSYLLKVFENSGTQKNTAAEITPASGKGFYSFTYNRFEELQNNIRTMRMDSLVAPNNHLLSFTGEAGVIYPANGISLFLKATDLELAKETFQDPPEVLSDYRGISIHKNTTQAEGLKYLIPIIPTVNINYYCFLDNYIIFAETRDALEEVIAAYLNQATLSHQPYYREATKNLAEASSLLIVNNTSITNSLFNDPSTDYTYDLEDYSIAAIQYVQEDGFAHVHGVINSFEGSVTERARQVTEITLAGKPATEVFLVKNHNNNQQEIAVQDENNILYLYSKNGELQWQKKFDSRILGKIHQVDIFKNGNLQLAFSTQNTLQVIDRNGKPVAPFPQNFKDNITQPLAVFDYDNNRDYRFVITQGKNILMYGSRGKKIQGFQFDGTGSPIIQAPKHLRTQSRDYILIPEEDETLNIISRQGKSRITVKENINFSENEWYLNNGDFVSVTAAGELVRINEQGNVKKESLPSEGKPRITTTERVLVSLSENILTINGKEITLDYGLYTKPQAFDLNKNSLITITDLQAYRVYVFDENGNLLPDFPVYGTSTAQMAQEGEKILLSVQGDEKNVLVYSF